MNSGLRERRWTNSLGGLNDGKALAVKKSRVPRGITAERAEHAERKDGLNKTEKVIGMLWEPDEVRSGCIERSLPEGVPRPAPGNENTTPPRHGPSTF
jgi:hypothetical protein